jgi:hypothetical protein
VGRKGGKGDRWWVTSLLAVELGSRRRWRRRHVHIHTTVPISFRTLYISTNVNHHRAGQPTELVKNAWQPQLMLRIFNFIAIKQGANIRRAHIRFRRYLCIFSARARVMPSPTAAPTPPYSWLGWFLITTTTSLLRSLRRCSRLSGYLRCYSPILHSATLLDPLALTRFPLSYYC